MAEHYYIMNILNKEGMLTDEDRKQPLAHMCNHVHFKSCIDLSDGVEVRAIGAADEDTPKKVTSEMYSRDLAIFMVWWTEFVYKDLNGFPGFSHVKFKFINVELI